MGGPLSGRALDWRLVLQWLEEDGVIDAAEAGRVRARCSTAESSQHPLVRLAGVGVWRNARACLICVLTRSRPMWPVWAKP